jgi:hypothetical protein
VALLRVEKDFSQRLGNIQMQREKIEEVYRKEKDFLTGQSDKAILSFSSTSNFEFQV